MENLTARMRSPVATLRGRNDDYHILNSNNKINKRPSALFFICIAS